VRKLPRRMLKAPPRALRMAIIESSREVKIDMRDFSWLSLDSSNITSSSDSFML
jgi:hypothetical protein